MAEEAGHNLAVGRAARVATATVVTAVLVRGAQEATGTVLAAEEAEATMAGEEVGDAPSGQAAVVVPAFPRAPTQRTHRAIRPGMDR